MTDPVSGSWPHYQCHIWIPSQIIGLKFCHNMVLYFRSICAIIATVYLADWYYSSQALWLGGIDHYFSCPIGFPCEVEVFVYFSISFKNCVGILIGITLTLQIAYSRMTIFYSIELNYP